MDDRGEELWLMLDCDTIVVQDPLPWLLKGVFQAKIAPIPSVTTEAFVRVFKHFGLPLPALSHVTPFTGTPTIPYYNGGVLAMPAAIARELAPAWRRYNQELADNPRLVDPCRRPMHQASLALVETGVPQHELPAAMNYQLNAAHMEPPPGFAETDPAIVHYHHLSGSDGQLLPCPYPRRRSGSTRSTRGCARKARLDEPRRRFPSTHRPRHAPLRHVRHYGSRARDGRLRGRAGGTAAAGHVQSDRLLGALAVQNLNIGLLKRLGGDWIEATAVDVARLPPDERAELARRAREIAAPLTLIKDPRMTVLFPLWREALDRPVCILAWREPVGVARSLANRDVLPLPFGLALWEHYTRSMLVDTRGLPRVIVSYDALIRDPIGTAHELYDRLNALGVRGLTLPSEEQLRQIVNPDFNRNAAADDSRWIRNSASCARRFAAARRSTTTSRRHRHASARCSSSSRT